MSVLSIITHGESYTVYYEYKILLKRTLSFSANKNLSYIFTHSHNKNKRSRALLCYIIAIYYMELNSSSPYTLKLRTMQLIRVVNHITQFARNRY